MFIFVNIISLPTLSTSCNIRIEMDITFFGAIYRTWDWLVSLVQKGKYKQRCPCPLPFLFEDKQERDRKN
jgi:hypothetical protein